MSFEASILSFASAAFMVLLSVFLLKGPRTASSRIYSFHIFSVFLWSFGLAAFYYVRDLSIALHWSALLYAGGSFIAASFLHFSFYYPERSRSLSRSKEVLIYLPAAIISVLLFFSPFVISSVTLVNDIKSYVYGPGHVLWDLQFDAMFMWAFVRFIIAYRANSGISQMRLRYILLGTLAALIVAGAANIILPWFGVFKYLWVGPVFSLSWLAFVAYAILKYHLLDIKIAATRAALFLIVYAAVLGIPFYILYYFGTTSFMTIAPLVAMLVLASLGPVIYRLLQGGADNVLLADQKRYRAYLLNASAHILKEHNLNDLTKLTVDIIKDSVGIAFGAIFVKANGHFTLQYINGSSFNGPAFPADSPFIKHLGSVPGIHYYEDLKDAPRGLFNHPVALIVPAISNRELVAFLVLGEKTNNSLFSDTDIDLFTALTPQIGLAIEYSLFLKEYIVLKDRAYIDNKRRQFFELIAGIVHKVNGFMNNLYLPANYLKLLIEDLKTAYPDIETHEIISTSYTDAKNALADMDDNVRKSHFILDETTRLAEVAAQELEFNFYSFKDLLLQACASINEKYHIEQLPLHFSSIDTQIYGNKEQLINILEALISNAYGATLDKTGILKQEDRINYTPSIDISLNEVGRSQRITVKDNGIGISDHQKEKIFHPFRSCSNSLIRAGIGLYVIKTMIEDIHGGKIWYDTEYEKGTSFYVQLPKEGEYYA